MEEYRLELRNVSTSFGEVKALEDINFQLGQNEVRFLLHELTAKRQKGKGEAKEKQIRR